MTIAGLGFVAIWNDVAPGAEEDFIAWHRQEHMPERLSIPGFLSGQRWNNERAKPRFFTLYVLENADVAASPAYIDRLNAPTPWTRRVMASYRNNARCVGSFPVGRGEAPGRHVAVGRFVDRPEDAAGIADRLMALEGVTGCHIGISDSNTSALATAERAGRTVAEPAGLVIVCLDSESAEIVIHIEACLKRAGASEPAMMTLALSHPAP
ncbi:DUF4286 family protein [Pelagibacterium lacus]|uniref:Uncharacterized protein n=1 Tax=Pelagibacterium lacus TaxID=2282655 RepID=A0A369W894_9HYPH|nr:DUF4286 family protein [Pelagibacterium lacus]RDE08281.1 hypothetical protein DVH29_12215 [Pelagibacterium lacus]